MMIIFIDLTNQIIEGDSNFTFYDTTVGRFLDFAGEQVFDSKEDFEHHIDRIRVGELPNRVKRCLELIPPDYA